MTGLSAGAWLRRSNNNSSSNITSRSNKQDAHAPSTRSTPSSYTQTDTSTTFAQAGAGGGSFNENLWPSFEPPVLIPGHAAATDSPAAANWTLDLGLSPPPARIRRGSEKSLARSTGREQLIANATEHSGANSPRERSLVPSLLGSSSHTRVIQHHASKDSSAGGSSADHSAVFLWKNSIDYPRREDSPASPRTFGGSSQSLEGDGRGRRRAASSSAGRRSSSPSGATPSSYASITSSLPRSEGDSLAAHSFQHGQGLASSAYTPRSKSSGLLSVVESSRAPSGRAGTFEQGSWEFRVAEELLATASSRASKSSVAVASGSGGASSTRIPVVPPGPVASTSTAPVTKKSAKSKGEKPRTRVESTPTPLFVKPVPPVPPRPRHKSLPSKPSRARLIVGPAPRVHVRASTPPDAGYDSGTGSDDPFYDAEEVAPNEQLWAVYPSTRAALGFSSARSSRTAMLGARESTHSILTFVSTSPPLSPSYLIHSTANQRDPFADGSTSSVHLPWPSTSLGRDSPQPSPDRFDEETIWLPLPIRPVCKSLPSSLRPTKASFLSAPPRELRRSWRREQRELRRVSALLGRAPPGVPSTLHEVGTSAENSSASQHLEDDAQENDDELTPSLNSTQDGWLGRQWSLSRFALVPPGAWCFVFGFICPPLWWVGAFYPRHVPPPPHLRSRSGATIEGPFSPWPDRRIGARKPRFDGSRGGLYNSRLTRWIEGIDATTLTTLPNKTNKYSSRGIAGGPGAASSHAAAKIATMGRETAVWHWRRRNRIMSIASIFIVSIVIGIAIWGGLTSTTGNDDHDATSVLGDGGGGLTSR